MSTRINDRIDALRNYMKTKSLNAFIVPSTDAHISESPPEYWEARQWISGFTGSAGTAVVTLDKAGLWTDSRYFLQAENELAGSDFVLYKERLPDSIKISDWLKGELFDGDRVGIDGSVYLAKDALEMIEKLKEDNIKVTADFDPFETIWQDRPPLPKNKVIEYPLEFAGETVRSKIERVLAEAAKHGAESVWISTLDTIAWLFNIRGSDVADTPVVVAHAFISSDMTVLFVDTDKLTLTLAEKLRSEGVFIIDYVSTGDYLAKMCNQSVCLDVARVSYKIYTVIKERNWVVETTSVADLLKSRKNEVEANGFRSVMIRDGVALTKFFFWLEKAVPEGIVTEYNIGLKLNELRSAGLHSRDESFPTIAGFGANAAINHYQPKEGDCLKVEQEGLLLIDSGGHYLDGTTDITRTVAVGPLSEEMKRDYTLVLKGMIGLSQAVFPAGTRGSQIDILARKAMWENGINYLHGTGHGVGCYLNVHEGPQSIRQEENPVAIEAGMVVSNEPGIYRDYKHGVRIENMMLVVPAMTTDFGDFLRFETLSLCPIDITPIITSMMTRDEIAWLNDYHQTVYEKISPFLTGEEKDWLKDKTTRIN